MDVNIEHRLPVVSGEDSDAASTFLGATPNIVSPEAQRYGDIYASADARVIAGNVTSVFTGAVARVELNISEEVARRLLSDQKKATKTDSTYHRLIEALQGNYEDLALSIPDDPYKDTCLWILSHPTYQKWQDDACCNFLWLCGPPGCGKTILAMFLLRKWSATLQDSHNYIHFFFSRQHEKTVSPQHCLSALLYQILLTYSSARAIVQNLPGMTTARSVASFCNSEGGIWMLLNQIKSSMLSDPARLQEKPLVCIFDALDECTDTSMGQFLQRLTQYFKDFPFSVKVLLTCRREYIDRIGEFQVPGGMINVVKENSTDIERYVKGNLQSWRTTSSDANISTKLENELINRAEGIFLWTALVVEGLLRRGTRLEIVLDTINSFPRGRDEKLKRIYDEILKEASHDLEDHYLIADIRSILNVTITASAPLSLEDLKSCLESGIMASKPLNLERDVKVACRGLLTIENGLVKPFHLTLRTYLESVDECLPQFYLSPAQRHASLAKACLNYTSECINSAPWKDENELDVFLTENGFIAYAASQWLYHVNGADTLCHDLVESIQDILGSVRGFYKWYDIILRLDNHLRRQLYLFRALCEDMVDTTWQPYPAHILSIAGIPQSLFTGLFRSKMYDHFRLEALGPDNQDGLGRAPAHWAAALRYQALHPGTFMQDWTPAPLTRTTENISPTNTNSDTLSYILSVYPASSQSRDHKGRTPLHIACRSSDVTKVRALLDAGADVHSSDILGYTALHRSSESASGTEIVRYLLQNATDLDVRTKEGRTPLHLAALTGMERNVSLLLAKGASLEAQDDFGRTAIHYAVQYGEDFAQIMINSMSNFGLVSAAIAQEPPAQLSSVFESIPQREKTIKRLIAAGARLECRSFAGETPLFMASVFGNLQPLQILLREKVDLNTPNHSGWTPLIHAAMMGREGFAKALINAGADILIADRDGFKAIHAAATMGYHRIVAALIEAGEDVNTPTHDGRTPLHIAAATDLEDSARFTAAQQDVAPERLIFIAALRNRKSASRLTDHEETIRELLKAGANVNAVESKEKISPLHIAAFHGYLPIVEILLQEGANVNATGEMSRTPLYMAAFAGHESCVASLIQYGASMQDEDLKRTPLHAASQAGHPSVVQILIDAGADLNRISHLGFTPIDYLITQNQMNFIPDGPINWNQTTGPYPFDETAMYCRRAQKLRTWEDMEEGQIVCLNILLASGATINHFDKDGITPLLRAVIRQRTSMVRLLVEFGAEVETRNNNNDTPLLLAVALENSEMIQTLLAAGADTATTNNNSWSPLAAAVLTADPKTVKELLANGADPSGSDENQQPLIVTALKNGQPAIIEALLEKHIELDALEKDGYYLLHMASDIGMSTVVKILLERDPTSVNRKNQESMSPLHLAAKNGHSEVAKALLEAGADVHMMSNESWTALSLAMSNEHPAMSQLLLDHGANPDTMLVESGLSCLHVSINTNNSDLSTLLLRKGANPDILTPDGKSPMIVAIQNGSVEMMDLMLNNGASLDMKYEMNYTALHFAAFMDSTDTMKRLIELEMQIDAIADDGNSPLMLAAMGNQIESIRLLLDYKADPNVRNNDANTPQQLAVIHNNLEMLKLLVSRGGSLEDINHDGESLLHAAVRHNPSATLEYLLVDKQLDPNICNALGRSPLHEAVRTRNFQATKLLLQASADPELPDEYGRNCFDWAMLNPEMFSIVFKDESSPPQQKKYKFSTEEEMKERLLSTIRLLLKRDDENNDLPREPQFSTFNQLGHCFLYLGDEEAASRCFEREMNVDVDTTLESLTHGENECSMCPADEQGSKIIVGRRYVCVECADVDLCETCMGEYAHKPSAALPGCRDDTFLMIPGPSWKFPNSRNSEGEGDGDLDFESEDQAWLKKLKYTYG